MATDIARLSFDAGRHYTGVVRQQGRVTLEAEENEALAIDLVERRAELLDIIGPAGTPDDGYAVSQGTSFDLIIGTGVMYVGGNRVELDTTLDYAHQPDWLDAATDPDWVPVPESAPPANEWIVLVVQERDVTAVEDPVLREVALGGPDGAARLRLLQHVERLATEADTCREAAGAQNKIWLEEDGLRWEPSLGVLASMTRLQVTWSGSTTPPDPCEPSAVGGYLGAQNQAFRVQINAVSTANGTVDLLWGPDDASMLYRVTSDGAAQPTLTFANTPVDAYHQPSMGQAVEVLRDAAQLASTDGVVEGYVASLTGQPFVLTDSYQPDARTLQLPSAITLPGAGDPTQTPQLYLRAWQGLLAGQPLDTPIALPGTGLEVTITTIGAAAAHRGDYWVIAARPAVPTNVFPARLLREGQPPDGPLQWACPLGIVGWTDGLLVTVDDCRKPFNPLTEATAGGGCCTLTVTPDNGQGLALQELIDKATAGRVVGDRWTHVTVCLRPGRYLLERPLLLRHLQSRLTIEACGGAAVLAAAEPQAAIFAEGLIVVTDAQEVTLSGLEIELPLVPYTKTGAGGLDLTHLEESLREFYVERAVGFGVRAVQAEGLTITGCTFRFHVGLATEARALASDQPAHVYAVGVLAQAECWNLTLEANRFAGTRHVRANRGRATAATKAGRELAGAVETHLLAGFLLSPSLLFKSSDAGAYEPSDQAAAQAVAASASASKTARATKAVKAARAPARSRARAGATTAAADQGLAAFPSGGLVRSVFDGASIRDNVFEELTIGVAAFADLGRIDIENNQFRRCYGAVWLFSMRAQASMDLVNAYAVADDQTEAAQNLASFSSAALLDPSVLLASVLGRTMPLPAGYSPGNRLRARVAQEVIAEAHHTDPAAWTAAFLETALSQLTDVRSPNVQPVPTPDKDTGSAKADTADAGDAGGADAATQAEATPTAGAPTATGDQEESDVPAPPAGWFQVDQTPRTVSPIEANLAAAHVVMSEFEREVAVEPARDHFELRLADNDMDCVTRASDTSGPVVAIWDLVGGDALPGGSAIVAANRIVGAAAWVALLAGATRVAVTGNIVVNTRKGGRSLGVVHALGGAAITGNVFTGHPLLPIRPAYTAPFNTWLPMNELL